MPSASRDRIQPELTSDRLRFRAATPDDLAWYRAMLCLPQVTRYSNIPDAPTEKRVARLISWMSKLYGKGNGGGWILEVQDGDIPIGVLRINRIDKTARCGEIGYELHPEYWGQGLMTEAVITLRDAAFGSLYGLNRLEGWTDPENTASARVLERAGFQSEGIHRQKMFYKKALHDVRIFACLAEDVADPVTANDRPGEGVPR